MVDDRDRAVVVHPGAEAVRDAAAAERDPAVRGALRVHVRVRLVAERLEAIPADRFPGLVAERAGDDHRAVHRQQRPVLARDVRGEPLGAAHDIRCAHVAGRGAGPPGRYRRHRGGLVEPDPGPGDRLGQPGDQVGGLHAGTVRRVEGADRPGHLQAVVQFRLFQVPNDPGIVAPRPFLLQPVAQPGLLGRRGGDGERAALHQARVDALGGADPRPPRRPCRGGAARARGRRPGPAGAWRSAPATRAVRPSPSRRSGRRRRTRRNSPRARRSGARGRRG